MSRPTRAEQRKARRALLRQVCAVGFAVLLAAAAHPPARVPDGSLASSLTQG